MFSLSIFLFVAFLMLFLGGVVFVHDLKNKSNRLFFLWVLSAVVWMIANYLENVSALSMQWREFFLHLDFAAGMIGSGFLMVFVLLFINPATTFRRQLSFLILPVIFGLGAFTPWHLARVYLSATGEIQFDEGWLFFFYAPTLIAYFIVPCVMLLRARRKAESTKRAQMSLIAAGLITSTSITLTINLFFQNVLTADQFRFGIYAMLFFIMSVAWAIIRHEFLRVRFVVTEVLFLGILATLLTRTILSVSTEDALINSASFVILLILGFAMVRSFLNEAQQRLELQVLTKMLEESNAHLKQMDDLKNEFISIASHQLRTPITVMKGYLSLMLEGAYGPLSSSLHEKVGNMNIMNERLVQMINNMLNVSRIEKNHIDFTCALIDIYPVIGQAVEEMGGKAAAKGISLRVDGATLGPAEAYVDMEKTMEVLTNLIDNSIKYSASGSIVVSATLQAKKKSVLVTVSDQGYGMNKQDLQKVFEKFYRSNDPNIMAQGGTGLGLYVCAMFVRGMGGDIWVERSAPGKGTVIAFALPTEPGGECVAPGKKSKRPSKSP